MAMGNAQQARVERIEARVNGPLGRTPEAGRLARRAEVSRAYRAWRRGEIERPVFDEEEDERLWELMETYERAALRVADRVAAKEETDGRY